MSYVGGGLTFLRFPLLICPTDQNESIFVNFSIWSTNTLFILRAFPFHICTALRKGYGGSRSEQGPDPSSNSKCSGSATLCQYAVAILKTKKQQLIKKRVKKIIGNDWTQNLYEKVATLTSTFLPTFAIRLKNRSRFPFFFLPTISKNHYTRSYINT